MTIEAELNALDNTKAAIRQAIVNKGVSVPSNTVFADYPSKISQIEGGSEPLLQNKTLTAGPSTSTISVVEPDSGYDGLSAVTVDLTYIEDRLDATNGVGPIYSSSGLLVQVIDYDGTVLKSDRLAPGSIFTLPSAPSHTGLTYQGWSSPVTITNNTVTVTDCDITIGAMYTVTSGLSEFDITLNSVTGLSVTLNMSGTKNWGDGTTDSLTSHTYSAAGDYTITCDGTTMTTSSSGGLFGQTSSVTNKYLKDVRLSQNISSNLGNNAFCYCSSLKSILIAKGITLIPSSCFSLCFSLHSVVIPNTVSEIKGNGFDACYSLRSIALPLGLINIGYSAFYEEYSLPSITLPEGLLYMGDYAFSKAGIESVVIPSTVVWSNVEDYESEEEWLEDLLKSGNPYGMFEECKCLKSIKFRDGVTVIPGEICENCLNLTNVYIPESVEYFGSYNHFIGSAIESISFPSNVSFSYDEDTMDYNFNECYRLKNIVIPEGVKVLSVTFIDCFSLTSVILPGSVEEISGAFTNCYSVLEYDFTHHESVPTLTNVNAFSGINIACKIKVPAALEASWKAATNWSTYADYIVGV